MHPNTSKGAPPPPSIPSTITQPAAAAASDRLLVRAGKACDIPAAAVIDDRARVPLPDDELLHVELPEGARAGMLIRFTLPDGRMGRATVPAVPEDQHILRLRMLPASSASAPPPSDQQQQPQILERRGSVGDGAGVGCSCGRPGGGACGEPGAVPVEGGAKAQGAVARAPPGDAGCDGGRERAG